MEIKRKTMGKPPSELTKFLAPKVRELWESISDRSCEWSLSDKIIAIHQEFYHQPELRTVLPANKVIQELHRGDPRSKTKRCVLFNTIANLVQK